MRLLAQSPLLTPLPIKMGEYRRSRGGGRAVARKIRPPPKPVLSPRRASLIPPHPGGRV